MSTWETQGGGVCHHFRMKNDLRREIWEKGAVRKRYSNEAAGS